jgi:hypothetical protein
MVCLKLYNFYDGKIGYYFSIDCPDGKREIKIGKKSSLCVKIPVLFQTLDGKREMCQIEYC